MKTIGYLLAASALPLFPAGVYLIANGMALNGILTMWTGLMVLASCFLMTRDQA